MERGFHVTISDSDIVRHRVTLLKNGEEVGTYEYDDVDVQYKPMEDDDPPEPQANLRTFDLLSGAAGTYWVELKLDGTYDVEYRSIDDAGLVSPPLEGGLTVDFVAPEVATGFDPF